MKLRDDLGGLSMLVSLLDSILFGSATEQVSKKCGVYYVEYCLKYAMEVFVGHS